MKTLKDIVKAQLQEFEKLIDNYYINRLAMHEGRAYMHTVVDTSELTDWYTKSIHEVIDKVEMRRYLEIRKNRYLK